MDFSSDEKFSYEFLGLLVYIILFLEVAYGLYYFAKKDKYNEMCHKIYSILRLLQVLVFAVFYFISMFFSMHVYFTNTSKEESENLLIQVMGNMILACIGFYNLYLSFNFIRIAFHRTYEKNEAKEYIENEYLLNN